MTIHRNFPNKHYSLKTLFVGVFIFSTINLFAKSPLLTADELSFPPPKIIRTCCSFGTNLGVVGIPFLKKTDITALNNLGPHKYLGNENEGNGNIYTKRGGFIDLGHVRDCADWTAYLYTLILANQENVDSISIDLGAEGGTKTLTLNIPQDFNNINAYQLAGKIAYDLSLWHEIATWYGASYIPMIPERYSSFSPEDLYSNLLGVKLGIQALKSDLEYNDAMTLLITNVLDSLEAVTTIAETYAAMEKVENIWWTREKQLPSKKVLLKRYFDSEQCLMPWLVPEENSELPPYKLVKPDDNFSDLYYLRIKVNFKFPIKTMASAPANKTITQKDFGFFMTNIKQDVDDLEIKIEYRSQRHKIRKERKLNLTSDKKIG